MLGYSSVEELQDKIQQGMPKKTYDTTELIHKVSEALDGNYKTENIWESDNVNLSEEARYESQDQIMDEAESDLELEI